MKWSEFLYQLKFQMLGPLFAVLVFLTASFIYFSILLANQLGQMRSRMVLISEVNQSLLEIANSRGRSKELIQLYALTKRPMYKRELQTNMNKRASLDKKLKASLDSLGSDTVLLTGFIEGGSATREIEMRIIEATDARDPDVGQLVEHHGVVYDFNTARLTDLSAHIKARLIESERELDSLLQYISLMIPIILVAAIVGIWLTALYYGSRVVSPLTRLRAAVRLVSSGDLDQKVHVKRGPRDIIEMANAFNYMTENLAQTRNEIIEAREEALRAAKVKSEFLANMSHEIRTPMNVIVGVADLMNEMDLTEELKKKTDLIQKGSHLLLNVVNDILDYSRLEAGMIQLDDKAFDLKSAVQRVVDLIRPSADEKGLEVECAFLDIPDLIWGDSKRIEQVILNLVSNAVKFTNDGKVIIDSRVIRHGDEARLQIKVIDTGIGIRSETLRQLFSRFVQGDSSITRTHGGTGLGLAIVRQLVVLMKGEVGVSSVYGEGSTFTVTIPLRFEERTEQASDAKAPVVARINHRQKVKVLLVDDSDDNRLLIKSYLSSPRFEVIEAINGLQAIDAFDKSRFDVILMDIQMPLMDGYRATEEIRQREGREGKKPTPIVAITAFAMREEKEKCLSVGCDVHLAKPILKQDLLSVIGDLVS